LKSYNMKKSYLSLKRNDRISLQTYFSLSSNSTELLSKKQTTKTKLVSHNKISHTVTVGASVSHSG
jgi:hypothetical protein